MIVNDWSGKAGKESKFMIGQVKKWQGRCGVARPGGDGSVLLRNRRVRNCLAGEAGRVAVRGELDWRDWLRSGRCGVE